MIQFHMPQEFGFPLTPETWLSLFYPILIFSPPIGEVCQKILYFCVVCTEFLLYSGSSDDTSKKFLLGVQVDSDSHKKEGPLNHVSVALVLFTSIPLEQ